MRKQNTSNYIKSSSPDDFFKNNMIISFGRRLLSKIDMMSQFDYIKDIVYMIRDDVSRPFIVKIATKIDTKYNAGLLNDSGIGNLTYESERRLNEDRATNLSIKSEIITFIEQYNDDKCSYENSQCYNRFMELKKIFKLSDTEINCLIFLFLYDINSCFTNFINDYTYDKSLFSRKKISKNIFSFLFNINSSEVSSLFSQKSGLIKYGLLDDSHEIDEDIYAYIEGFSNEPLINRYYKEFKGDRLNIDNFSFKPKDIDMLNRILSQKTTTGNGFKILFYGKPGTGKTEFARSLSGSHNYKTYELLQVNKNTDNEKSDDDKFRLQGLYAFENISTDELSLMIIDEADGFLSSKESGLFGNNINEKKKGMINYCFDELQHNQIWIMNNVHNLDESTKRRFDYSIEFPDLSFNQRKNIWNTILKKTDFNDLLDDADLIYLTENYQVNAGIIDKAIENCKRVVSDFTNKKEFISVLETSLNAHLILLNGKSNAGKTNKDPNFAKYSIDGLNIKCDLKNHLTILDRFNTLWEEGDTSVRNMNVLMWGPPGTGKTELAKYIARRLNRKLIVKTASDILDKYVGGTEENIARAFKEAEREKAILFIDEIDGLLANRGNSQRSWEVTQVNELLVQMENFNGILLCATNFFNNIDQAATRRFNIKIEFDYLNESGIEFFYNLFFSDLTKNELNENECIRLKSIKSLTPGDFKVAYQKLSLFANDLIDPQIVINNLNDEAKIKCGISRKIGF